jgi:hypothetical protein
LDTSYSQSPSKTDLKNKFDKNNIEIHPMIKLKEVHSSAVFYKSKGNATSRTQTKAFMSSPENEQGSDDRYNKVDYIISYHIVLSNTLFNIFLLNH